jgi:plastocyanin
VPTKNLVTLKFVKASFVIEMKKGIAILGVVILIVAAFLFLIVFSNGTLAGIGITGSNATANFVAFLFVIIALPVGSGLAYFGLSYRTPIFAAGAPTQVVYRSSRIGTAALAIAIIALIIALAEFAVIYQGLGAANSSINGLSTSLTSANSAVNSRLSNYSSLNVAPTAVGIKIDWCNTDNTGQDRFCPSTLVVDQGDIVQIMFIHNDTDAHTFTLDTTPYFFQINASSAGMHNFLSNGFNAGNCSNSGTPAEQTAAISSVYCVSGTSLLTNATLSGPLGQGANFFVIPQNPNPAASLNGSSPDILPVDNMVHFVNTTAAAIALGATETWGDGAFQATTPGVYEFFCHYHVSNGMFGYLIVLPNAYCNTNPKVCNIYNSTAT